ncbi:MAG: hypothetical protein K2X38_23375 [Gemmataceae bacterium]|nr:hypothetical protein [Gemmataceae bacterium]
MRTVTIPKEWEQFFAGVHGVAEIRDPSGRLLGHFASPIPDQAELLRRATTRFDADAARKRLETERDRCISSEEVLQRLRSREPAA